MNNDTICSVSTPHGLGAISVLRLSGQEAFSIAQTLFTVNLNALRPREAKYAELCDKGQLIDQAVIVKYVAPHSYTGENMLEISCHGSLFIQQKILELLIENGCRMATPGEYTMRAFMNGKMDLPQAEAIGDLIDSQSEASHHLAVNQLKGVFSDKIKELRAQFVELASLLELELDFSEEDVQFANRDKLLDIIQKLNAEVAVLLASFKTGNAIKQGIPVAIIGKPNVGKSTLLNALLQEDRAIVSNIPGTTRDTIEDVLNLNGTLFRFIDTAGIRASDDEIENFGIERTYKAVAKADIVMYVIDVNETSLEEVCSEVDFLNTETDMTDKKLLIVANKIDGLQEMPQQFRKWNDMDMLYVSAKRKVNMEGITDALMQFVSEHRLTDTAVMTNARHYDVMLKIKDALERAEQSLCNDIPTDLVAIDVREALHHLGIITGEVATDEILNNVFGKFCIGK